MSARTVFGIIAGLLSFLCFYQIGYFSKGLLSMGFDYFTKFKIAEVLIIVPGLVLGVHTTQKLLDPSTQNHWGYRWVSVAYLAIAAMEVAFLIYAASNRQMHQIEPQYADSFNKAAHWWVWYYAGMVVTPS